MKSEPYGKLNGWLGKKWGRGAAAVTDDESKLGHMNRRQSRKIGMGHSLKKRPGMKAFIRPLCSPISKKGEIVSLERGMRPAQSL